MRLCVKIWIIYAIVYYWKVEKAYYDFFIYHNHVNSICNHKSESLSGTTVFHQKSCNTDMSVCNSRLWFLGKKQMFFCFFKKTSYTCSPGWSPRRWWWLLMLEKMNLLSVNSSQFTNISSNTSCSDWGQLNWDFTKTAPNIYIHGHKISLYLTIKNVPNANT